MSVTCSGSLKATVAKHVKHVAIKSWGGFGDGVHLKWDWTWSRWWQKSSQCVWVAILWVKSSNSLSIDGHFSKKIMYFITQVFCFSDNLTEHCTLQPLEKVMEKDKIYWENEMETHITVRGNPQSKQQISSQRAISFGLDTKSLYWSQVTHSTRAYSSFHGMNWLRVSLLLPGWDGSPSQGYSQHFIRLPS